MIGVVDEALFSKCIAEVFDMCNCWELPFINFALILFFINFDQNFDQFYPFAFIRVTGITTNLL